MKSKKRGMEREKELAEYKDLFRVFDKDGDGCISAEEMRFMMQAMGQNPTEAEAQTTVKVFDVNGNQTFDFEDFVKVMDQLPQDTNSEEELKEVFKVFDHDCNGYISVTDLCHTMTVMGESMTHEEAHEWIQKVDMDGDGQISYEEFVKMSMSE